MFLRSATNLELNPKTSLADLPMLNQNWVGLIEANNNHLVATMWNVFWWKLLYFTTKVVFFISFFLFLWLKPLHDSFFSQLRSFFSISFFGDKYPLMVKKCSFFFFAPKVVFFSFFFIFVLKVGFFVSFFFPTMETT